MNSILRKITNEMWNSDTDYFSKKVGNYLVRRTDFYNDKVLIKHYYFGNKICQVDVNEKTFELYDCGYKNYRLTTAQLNYLEQFYKNKGFKLTYRGV